MAYWPKPPWLATKRFINKCTNYIGLGQPLFVVKFGNYPLTTRKSKKTWNRRSNPTCSARADKFEKA